MKRIAEILSLYLAASLLLVSSAFAKTSEGDAEQRWNFRVFLDDQEIGYHRVRVLPGSDSERVKVEAKFDVKVLFLTAYKYDHLAEEIWQNDCLTDIQSRTDANGKQQFVRTRESEDGLHLETHNGSTQVSGCLRSVAYWAPERLQYARLLNTQTGDLQNATMTDIGSNPIEIDGELVDAVQYRLSIDETDIDLWYTPDQQWLALKTITKDGRELSYIPDMEAGR